VSEQPDSPRRNIKLVIAYDGTDFCGWQKQSGVRTVQEVLEGAIARVVRHPVGLLAAGRTDSGVHAAGQVAQFATDCGIPCDRLLPAIRSKLPDDVSLVRLGEVPPEFHATRSAFAKLYRYRIWNASSRPVENRLQRYTYHFWYPLDVEAMRQAAAHFLGRKDFAALASKGSERRTTVRTVFRCEVYRHYREIRIDVEGSGFLYKQVRNMVGTLIEVGRGHWPPEKVAEILASRDRANAGRSVPACGLTLQWVRYIPGLWRPHPEQRQFEYEDEGADPASRDADSSRGDDPSGLDGSNA